METITTPLAGVIVESDGTFKGTGKITLAIWSTAGSLIG